MPNVRRQLPLCGCVGESQRPHCGSLDGEQLVAQKHDDRMMVNTFNEQQHVQVAMRKWIDAMYAPGP